MRSVNQVCTFEQAEQLKALGIKQLSLFYWISSPEPAVIFCPKPINNPDTFSAFTSAELGIILPEDCSCKKVNRERLLNDFDFKTAYLCSFDDKVGSCRNMIGPSEAFVKADLLLYLINKRYITIEVVNSRLREADAL
jgi:hypothetical protein